MSPQSSLETPASRRQAFLVTFRWDEGFSLVKGYTNYDSDITIAGSTWIAVPEMAIEVGKFTGSSAPESSVLHLPFELLPVPFLANGEPFCPVSVEIEECDPDDAANTRRQLSFGLVAVATSGSQIVKLDIPNLKHALQIKLGMMATTTCNWAFGDTNCCIDTDEITETGTITAIDGHDITVTGLVTTTAGYWHRGLVKSAGLRIGVRYHATGGTMTLMRRPPSYWLNREVSFIPGCDKQKSTCENKWNNIARFGGFGMKMLPYNPNFETR